MTTKTRNSPRNAAWTGMNWIRQDKRLAIYLRDGCACAWCGASVEQGAKLTLDHLKPHNKGGTNEADNLITACLSCNSARGKRTVAGFAKAVAAYLNHNVEHTDILSHIRRCRTRTLPMLQARLLIAARGTAAKVLAARAAATL